MKLPDFLHEVDGAVIRLVGHRIGLHDIVRLYNEGFTVEMMAGQFDTLPMALIHKVLGFYLENAAEVDKYMAEYDRTSDAIAAAILAKPSTAPNLAELRRRMQSMQRTQVR